MSTPHTLAGIYFADDHVIWATASVRSTGSKHSKKQTGLLNVELDLGERDFLKNLFEEDERIPARRIPASHNPKKDLQRIRHEMMASKVDLEKIEAIVTASVGPFKDGRAGHAGGGTILSGSRMNKGEEFNLHAAVKEVFKRKDKSSPAVSCLGDTEAHVFGEHYLFRNHGDNERAAEKHKDSTIGKDTIAYLMIDEGVGGAVLQRGKFVKGDAPLQIGHMTIQQHSKDECEPPSSCPAHHYPCLESLVSLKAIRDRWELSVNELEALDPNSDILRLLAFYIAQAVFQISLFFTPTVILLGGRVMDNPALIDHVLHYRKLLALGDHSEDLFPPYPAQKKSNIPPAPRSGAFIKKGTMADTGVLGCLYWGYGVAITARENKITSIRTGNKNGKK